MHRHKACESLPVRGVVEGDGFDLAQLFAEHSDFGGGEIEMHFAFEELETEFLKDLLTRLKK